CLSSIQDSIHSRISFGQNESRWTLQKTPPDLVRHTTTLGGSKTR
ncbi:unnamed protein product, partial [Brassica oleracea var. botrytis]